MPAATAGASPRHAAIAPAYGQTSLGWSGYQDPESGIEGVEGSWTVGTANASADGLATSWIGIGTPAVGDLFQVGVEDNPGGGDEAYYELPGHAPTEIPGTVQPGEVVNAVIEEGGRPGDWVVEMGDPTEGWGFDQAVTYSTGAVTGGEWIVSNPNPPNTPISDFGTITFSSTQVGLNTPGMDPGNPEWVPTSLTTADAVTIIDPSDTHILAQPSLILPYPVGQSFTDTYVYAPYAPLNLTATVVSRRSVQLRWQLPILDGGEPFAYYTVNEYRNGRWLRTINTPNDLPHLLVTGLSSRDRYRFNVAANNAGGWQGPATAATRSIRP